MQDRPYIHLNLAVSDQGRTAAGDGKPLAISCAADWRRVHLLRESYGGVAVGARTWLQDQPRLSVRQDVLGRPPARQPARVVFAGGQALDVAGCPDRPTFVIGRRQPAGDVTHIASGDRRLRVPLAHLAVSGLRSLLVEGGPTLLGSFLEQGLYDRLTVFVPTREVDTAARAVARALPQAPPLGAVALGNGLLFESASPSRTDGSHATNDGGLGALLSGRVSYLDPDACGAPNGGVRGERLALLGPVPLPIEVGGVRHAFAWSVFARVAAGEESPAGPLANSVLAYGDLTRAEPPLVRIHSGCHTGDIFGSARCDCGPQLAAALAAIVAHGSGVALYVTEHEGRGVGLWHKALAYLLQDRGADTYEANRLLGCPEDARRYADAAVVLAHTLGRRRIRLLSNNPAKLEAVAAAGFEVVEMRRLLAGHNEVNHRYLAAKARHGHLLPVSVAGSSTHATLPIGGR